MKVTVSSVLRLNGGTVEPLTKIRPADELKLTLKQGFVFGEGFINIKGDENPQFLPSLLRVPFKL